MRWTSIFDVLFSLMWVIEKIAQPLDLRQMRQLMRREVTDLLFDGYNPNLSATSRQASFHFTFFHLSLIAASLEWSLM